MESTVITIEAAIEAPVNKVWTYFTEPNYITQWNFASDDWHSPRAENDLRVGGSFTSRMEAKDGSFGFDFGGVYTEVRTNEYIAYVLGDGRKVDIRMESEGNITKLTQNFEAEQQNPIEMQKGGWQAILNNFKKFVENN